MNVLVADDSGIVRSILVQLLRMMGVRRIVEAGDGQEAWDAYATQPADLVLTDWHMPKVDGLELVKLIRAVDGDVPILMITVVDSRGSIIEAIRARVNDYVCKPLDRDN